MSTKKLKGSTSRISSKSSKSSSSKCKNPPSSAMITQLRIPSNLCYFRDLIDKRIVLDEKHMDALRTTPFHNFIRIPTSLSNEQITIDCLIEKFNPDKCSFMIGNKDYVFGIEDVHRITGLPNEGIPINMSGTAANTIYTQFVNYKTPKEKKGSRSKGKKKVDEESKGVIWGKRGRMAELIVEMAQQDHITCVKLIVAFIIGFILCPRTCKTCPLWAFRYAEHLPTLKNYNWCRAVFTFLCKEMNKAKKSISMRGLGERSYAGYMGGFSSVLLVWFYELVGELEWASDIEGLPPLFCVKNIGKWRRTKMNKLFRDPKGLMDAGQEHTPLIHRASPQEIESRKAELITLIAKKTIELHELTTELQELEERGARGLNKNKEDKKADDYENEEEKEVKDNEKEKDENITEEKDTKDKVEEQSVVEGDNAEGMREDANFSDFVLSPRNFEILKEADIDDDFVMRPREMKISEDARDVSQKEEGGNDNKRGTPSIKRAVRNRKRKDGPSVSSPYLRLDQPKDGTKKKCAIQIMDSPEGATKKKCIKGKGFIPKSRNYPGKALVYDYEDKLIDNFLQSKITSDTFIWTCTEASVSRLDAYKLLTGGALGGDVIDAFVIRLCHKIETTDIYDRKIHVTRPWLAQAFLEGNLELMANRMKENISEQKFLMCERILIPIVSSGHWHMVELVREEKKFYHYSSIKSPIYTADAAKFRNTFMTFIESNWTLGKLEHHELVSVAVPQQGPTLDCGIFMMQFINSIVEKRSITISQEECGKYRAKFCADLLYASTSPYDDCKSVV